MSNIKSWGKFLSGLNHAGKAGKVIKTIPEFAPDTDPELVKFNIAIANAKKNGHYVITRKNEKSDYATETNDDIVPFLNNEYVGILTTKNGQIYILEFEKISTREYDENSEYQILPAVSAIEPVDSNHEKEFKNFNKALKAAAKWQCIVKDSKKGYDTESKNGMDVLKRMIKYKYFGFFSKKPNLLEYVRFGYRKVVDQMDAPLPYGGKDTTNTGPLIGDFLSIETNVVEPKTKIKKANTSDINTRSYSYALKQLSSAILGYIKRKNSKSAYEYLYVANYLFNKPSFPKMLIDSFLNNEYNALVTKNSVLEYYKFNVRPIEPNMSIDEVLVDRLKTQLAWEGDAWETKNFNQILEKSTIVIRGKKGFEPEKLTKDNISTIERLAKEEIEYFCVKSTSNKLYEYILIDKRERTSKEEPVIYNK